MILVFENGARPGRAFKRSTFDRGKMADVWRIKKGKSIKENNACFPLELAMNVLENWESGRVLDPFIGSGTTAIACELLGKQWIGIEKTEGCCEIAAKRIEQEASQLKLF